MGNAIRGIVLLEIISPLTTAFSILFSFWWVYAPFLLFVGVIAGRQNYLDLKYFNSLKWVLLEIKPPPEVTKSPKVAEYIFANLHGTYLPTNWKDRFFKGKVIDWFSLEIVSHGGDSRFFIRTLEAHRNLVEAQIFAQYPNAEISQIDSDYVNKLPRYLPNDEYNLFGSELAFSKSDAYPILTHPYFEEESRAKEVETFRTDPLSALFEVMSTLDSREHIWIQFLIRPTGEVLVTQAKEATDVLIGKEKKVEPSAAEKVFDSLAGLVFSAPEPEKKDTKEPSMVNLTPGNRDVVLNMEKKAAKLAYETGIRFMYIAPKDNFQRSKVIGIFGFFKQFSTLNMNGFKPDKNTITFSKGYLYTIFPSDKGFLASAKEFKRKVNLYKNYRKRKFVKTPLVLNVEELATLYHLPGSSIKAPLFPRVEAKKSQPPAGLPLSE